MELHDGQKSVRSLLYRGNVCVRVGRRWGKNFLLGTLAETELQSGHNVIYVAPYYRFKHEVKDLTGYDKFSFFTSGEGLGDISGADLLILNEPAYFDPTFWDAAYPVIERSKRVIAIGTQDYTATSAKYFAMLPFEPGWAFYSGGSEECPIIPKGLLDEIKAERPEIYKVQYGGH